MKIAGKKTQQVAERERMKSVVGNTHTQKGNAGNTPANVDGSSSDKKSRAPGRGEREGSPLGKQLLEKSGSRGRRKVTCSYKYLMLGGWEVSRPLQDTLSFFCLGGCPVKVRSISPGRLQMAVHEEPQLPMLQIALIRPRLCT